MTGVHLQTRVALVAVATDGWQMQQKSATESVGGLLVELRRFKGNLKEVGGLVMLLQQHWDLPGGINFSPKPAPGPTVSRLQYFKICHFYVSLTAIKCCICRPGCRHLQFAYWPSCESCPQMPAWICTPASASTLKVFPSVLRALVCSTQYHPGVVLPYCILQRVPVNLSRVQTTPRADFPTCKKHHTWVFLEGLKSPDSVNRQQRMDRRIDQQLSGSRARSKEPGQQHRS